MPVLMGRCAVPHRGGTRQRTTEVLLSARPGLVEQQGAGTRYSKERIALLWNSSFILGPR